MIDQHLNDKLDLSDVIVKVHLLINFDTIRRRFLETSPSNQYTKYLTISTNLQLQSFRSHGIVHRSTLHGLPTCSAKGHILAIDAFTLCAPYQPNL